MHTPIQSRRFHALALSALFTAALAACGGGDDPAAPVPTTARLNLELTGLEDLGPSAVYEGWLMVNGAPVSAGRFSVDAAGKPSPASFDLPIAQANSATAYILTIEPATGDDPAPSVTHLVAGDFNADKSRAAVSIGHAAALGTTLASAAGSFILATPTSAATNDDSQGIWFLNMVGGAPQASLTLPTLPSGWVYEGWAVVGGTPVSTGRFTRATGADSDGAGPAAGPLGAPPFPGQDFIAPARVLTGGTAVISIEPLVDNSPKPFLLKPLAGAIGNATGAAAVHSLSNTVGGGNGLPAGSVSWTR